MHEQPFLNCQNIVNNNFRAPILSRVFEKFGEEEYVGTFAIYALKLIHIEIGEKRNTIYLFYAIKFHLYFLSRYGY